MKHQSFVQKWTKQLLSFFPLSLFFFSLFCSSKVEQKDSVEKVAFFWYILILSIELDEREERDQTRVFVKSSTLSFFNVYLEKDGGSSPVTFIINQELINYENDAFCSSSLPLASTWWVWYNIKLFLQRLADDKSCCNIKNDHNFVVNANAENQTWGRWVQSASAISVLCGPLKLYMFNPDGDILWIIWLLND